MIIVSDNIAVDMLMKKIDIKQLNTHLKSLGMENTQVNRNTKQLLNDLHKKGAAAFLKNKQDTTTPKDMAHLFKLIALEKAAKPDSCQTMLKILFSQKLNTRLPRFLNRVAVAHKTGSTNLVTNDVGILALPNGTKVVLTVFTIKDNESIPTFLAEDVIGRIAQKVAVYYSGVSNASSTS